MAIKTIQNETEKKIDKTETIRELWKNFKQLNIYVTGGPREEKELQTKQIFD